MSVFLNLDIISISTKPGVRMETSKRQGFDTYFIAHCSVTHDFVWVYK